MPAARVLMLLWLPCATERWRRRKRLRNRDRVCMPGTGLATRWEGKAQKVAMGGELKMQRTK